MDELRVKARKVDGVLRVDVLAYGDTKFLWQRGVDVKLTDAVKALTPDEFDKRIAEPALEALSNSTGVYIAPKTLRALLDG